MHIVCDLNESQPLVLLLSFSSSLVLCDFSFVFLYLYVGHPPPPSAINIRLPLPFPHFNQLTSLFWLSGSLIDIVVHLSPSQRLCLIYKRCSISHSHPKVKITFFFPLNVFVSWCVNSINDCFSNCSFLRDFTAKSGMKNVYIDVVHCVFVTWTHTHTSTFQWVIL